MKFIHEGTKYEIEPSKLTFAEARAFEKSSGHTMGELSKSGVEDIASIQALFWIAMKRVEPTLRYSDLDEMNMGDFEQLPDDEDENRSDGEEPADPTAPGDGDGEGSTPSE